MGTLPFYLLSIRVLSRATTLNAYILLLYKVSMVKVMTEYEKGWRTTIRKLRKVRRDEIEATRVGSLEFMNEAGDI